VVGATGDRRSNLFEKVTLIPAGTTTAQTGATVQVADTCATIAFAMTVSAASGAPTLTWTIQGSVDGTVFYPIAYVTDLTDTAAVAARTDTPTTGMQKIEWLSNPLARRYRYYRAVTSSVVTTTYGIDAYLIGN
jgi:hypothetical protein